MTTQTFSDRLRQAMMESGINQSELARRAGVTAATISQWMTGTTNPNSIRAAALETAAGALGVSVRWLLTGRHDEIVAVPDGLKAAPPDVRNIPLISLVKAGFDGDVADPYPRGTGSADVPVDTELARTLSRTAFALEITGDSMADLFMPGDVVIIDPLVRPLPGDFVVAKIDDDKHATFKKYRARGVGVTGVEIFELVPLNENYATVTVSAENPGRVIGTMVEHRRRRRR